jgi:peptidylprolyl isomerase
LNDGFKGARNRRYSFAVLNRLRSYRLGKFASIPALALVSSIWITGCASSEPEAAAPTGVTETEAQTPLPADDLAVVDQITVSGGGDTEPVLGFETPISVGAPTTRLVNEGDGDPILEGHRVQVMAASWRGDTGDLVFSTWESGAAESFIMGGAQFMVLSDVLQTAQVGAQIIVANPTTYDGTRLTMVSVFEVVSTQANLNRAEGEQMPVQDAGLPIVELAEGGEPSIIMPDGFVEPSELGIHTLIRGNGPVVVPGATVVAHYTGWLTNGDVFDSSWARNEPATFPLDRVIQGWSQGLAGQTVGSQVLLVIPPELAYGSTAIGSIPANSTLIFVVDLLSAD